MSSATTPSLWWGIVVVENPPPILAHLIIYLFRICCENFRPRPRNVRSPGHVKWHLIISLNARQSYTDWIITLKLLAIDTSNSTYKMYISEFWYWWPMVRSIVWPLHYLIQWEKIEKRLFWTTAILNTLKHRFTGRIDTLNRKSATSDPSGWPQGHQVMKGHRQFFSNNFW